MKNNTFTAILAVMLAVALMLSFTACGSKEAPETAAPTEATAAKPLPTVSGQTGELANFTMTATAWSSSNGATITFAATPENHEDGQSAIVLARLEGEEADRVECNWDGKSYTAELDLNAADGYFYYCVLVAPDGTEKEVDINTPDNMASPELISLATALESYCTMTLNESKVEGDSLSIRRNRGRQPGTGHSRRNRRSVLPGQAHRHQLHHPRTGRGPAAGSDAGCHPVRRPGSLRHRRQLALCRRRTAWCCWLIPTIHISFPAAVPPGAAAILFFLENPVFSPFPGKNRY